MYQQYQKQEANEATKKIFTDLLFGNYIKDYRIESGATIQENKDYKSALFNYNIILDYVRNLQNEDLLQKVIVGTIKFNEDYYLDETTTHQEAFEQYKMDSFSQTLLEHFKFVEGDLEVDRNDAEGFELLEDNINKIYNVFVKKLKTQKPR
jgi:hypothetical protein